MRYGTVLSGGKKIIPLGDSLCLRFMLDDWQKGNFWNRKMYYHDEGTRKVFLEKRTYKQQIVDAIKEGAKELFFVIGTPKGDYSGQREFAVDIYKKCRELGYKGEIIFDPENEPLEMLSTGQYIQLCNNLAEVIQQLDGASLSIGGMASEFTGFFKQITEKVTYYRYVDFHTSNDGNLWSIDWLLRYLPEDTIFINSEHYLWNCGFNKGYDSDECVHTMKILTDYMFSNKRIKSIYVCMPSAYVEDFKYKPITLRYVDKNNNVIYTTRMWYLLKLYEKGEKVMAKLKELKKGDRGVDVLALQNALFDCECDPKGTDGIFGSNTEKAVKKFQKKAGLKETGVCDYLVWYTLLGSEKGRCAVEDLFEMLKVM